MFSESAKYYDILYSWKNYAGEAEAISNLIKQHHQQAKTILDIGCGTAEHHRHLSKEFELEGLDLDENLLRIAQEKFPAASFHHADMSEFDLGKKFDVVICLFSSIGYLSTKDKLNAALTRFAAHLQPGGIVIVEPWLSREQWKDGRVSMLTHETDDLKICRMNYNTTDGMFSILDFHYLIGQPGVGVRTVEERHILAMFTEAEFRTAFQQAGLSVTYDPQGLTGRGLYVGKLS